MDSSREDLAVSADRAEDPWVFVDRREVGYRDGGRCGGLFCVEQYRRVKRPFLEVVLGVNAGDEAIADDPLGAFQARHDVAPLRRETLQSCRLEGAYTVRWALGALPA